MRHSTNADFLATSRAPESSILLGTAMWIVHNDSQKCSDEGKTSYTTNLTLHACHHENFACSNAFCIPMGKRCDAIEDCMDGSDEQDCGKLIRRQGYKKELTPVTKDGGHVLVNFSLNILDIEVYETTETFRTMILLSRSWFDGRLMYKHVKKDSWRKMNTLLSTESESIWYPFFVSYNVRTLGDIKRTEVPNVFEVIPNDDFAFLADNNMHIFNGSENALSLRIQYNIDWKCSYAYHWYPFDNQVCRMEFLSIKPHTVLQPIELQHNPNISLSCYSVRKTHMCKSIIANMSAIVVEFSLGRPIINNLLTNFVPTILLVIISFAARFFVEDYIDMVIQVNLTILLVLATM